MPSFIITISFFFLTLLDASIKGERTSGRPQHLFVQRREPLRGSSLPVHEILLSKNGSSLSKSQQNVDHRSPRTRRAAQTTGNAKREPEKSKHEFGDNHNMLFVHWSGFSHSDTVVVLSRDIRPGSGSTSYLYVSNDYGKVYHNQSDKFQYTKGSDTKYGLINRFYTSKVDPKRYIFADIFNNMLFISTDDCVSLKRSPLSFKPSDIIFHPKNKDGLLAYDESTKILYSSTNFGTTWNKRRNDVISYFWGIEKLDSDNIVYLEIAVGNVSKVVRGHYNHQHYFEHQIIDGISDFEIQGNYIFATKKSSKGLDLHVAYHYHKFEKAEFPLDSPNQDYFIADASEGQVFVAVNHNINTTHLYISDVTGKKYTLSLERVLYYNPAHHRRWLRRYIKYTFIDLHAVASMRGVYLASQLAYGDVGRRAIYSVITYDKGNVWFKLRAPTYHSDGSKINCSLVNSCSLHVGSSFTAHHPRYYIPPIKSKASAPGLIVASGNLGTRLGYPSNIYLSNNAGETWLEVLDGRNYFNFGDHGGVVVAVRQWSPTKELLYSTDEGLNWTRYNFTDKPMRVYGLLTEPGEKTTIFTIFGSYTEHHAWLVFQVNMTNVFDRVCQQSDYEKWSPYSYGLGHRCLLGQKLVFERRKRSTTCFNGHDYDRPVNTTICSCNWKDFECDVGFRRIWNFFCFRDYNAGFNPYAPPRPCNQFYNRTRGHRKITGDKCTGGSERWYKPYRASCPVELDKAYLLYAELDKIQYVDLTNSTRSSAIIGLRGAVALTYDIKEGYIYWADMLDHRILRRTLNGTDAVKIIAGINQVEGMDFDWTTGNLYWVDSADGVIEVCRKDGRFRKTLHRDNLDRPRALAIDPINGKMYWSDWGTIARIEMSDMDGTNRVFLVTKSVTDIQWPNGLAIDFFTQPAARTLYWTDAKLDIIVQYDINTKKVRIIASKKDFAIMKHPYSIAVDDRNVYWDDWTTGDLYQFKKPFKKPEVPITLVPGEKGSASTKKFEVKVYYQKSQKDTSNCKNDSCSQLCLPKATGYNCTCGDDMELDPSSTNGQCRCLGDLTMLPNGTCERQGNASCLPSEFSCDNGDCIPDWWQCDNDNDCGDFSDERSCMNITCQIYQYRCATGMCIPSYYRCNGDADCEDNSDEYNCNSTHCQLDEFQCSNGKCIPADLQCNSNDDCGDNSDEFVCTTQPTGCRHTDDFMCDDFSSCISKKGLCNGYANCRDNSDEIGCVHYCAAGYFMCEDGSACILNTERCDGKKNCKFDGSDERLCFLTTPKPSASTRQPTTTTTNASTRQSTATTTNASTRQSTATTTNASTRQSTATTTNASTRQPTARTTNATANHSVDAHVAGKRESKTKKTLIWAVPVSVVFAVMLVVLVYFAVKSRRLQRSFYHLIRSDSFDGGVAYHNTGDDDDVPLIQGFSDDDPLVEA